MYKRQGQVVSLLGQSLLRFAWAVWSSAVVSTQTYIETTKTPSGRQCPGGIPIDLILVQYNTRTNGIVLVLQAVHCNVLVMSTVHWFRGREGRRLPNLGPEIESRRDLARRSSHRGSATLRQALGIRTRLDGTKHD